MRTTHLTGIFTDLGLMLGKALKGDPFDTRKGVMFLLIIIGFLLGGITGFILFEYSSILALVLPALACFVLSVTYRVYRIRAL